MNSGCPQPQELAGLLTGTMEESGAGAIMAHLEACPVCDETIDGLQASADTLVQHISNPAPYDAFAEEPECRRLTEYLDSLGPFACTVGRDDQDEDLSQQVVGPYRLLKRLGTGGMGAVYKAMHTKLDKVVALKVMSRSRSQDAHSVSRFEREMRAVGRLEHPHLVQATDAGEINGSHYLVMELLDGADLSAISERSEQISVADACEMIRQAALGLQEAHRHGMVHRDIKPSNLMLARRSGSPPIVKVLDMGLALLTDDHGSADLTTENQIMGTLNFMAPEQATGAHTVDIRSDVYSLGATLFKLLTGNAPLDHNNQQTTLQKLAAIANVDAPPVNQLRRDAPSALAKVIDDALKKHPDDRIETPGQLAERLEAFCHGHDLRRLLDETGTPNQNSLASDVETVTGCLDESANVPATEDQNSQMRVSPAIAGGDKGVRRIVLTLAGAAAAGLVWLGIIYLKTQNGTTIAIDIRDPEIQVSIIGERLLLTHDDSGQPLEVTPGKKALAIRFGQLNFTTSEFQLKRGENVRMSVYLEQEAVVVTNQSTSGQRIAVRPVESMSSQQVTEGTSRQATQPATGNLSRAVTWVLEVGGAVSVLNGHGGKMPVTRGGKMPGPRDALHVALYDHPALNSPEFAVLAGLPQIHELDVMTRQPDGPGITQETLHTIRTLPGLKWLRADIDPSLRADDLHGLSELPNLESLHLLNVYSSLNTYSDEIVQSVCRLEGLKSLSLGSANAQFSDAGLAAIAELKKLEHLSLVGNGLTDHGLSQVTSSLTQLTYLHVHDKADSVTGKFLSEVGELKHLEELYLILPALTDDQLTHINSCEALHTLRVVYSAEANCVSLGDFSYPQNLRHLTLHGAGVTDEALARLACFTALSHLGLTECQALTSTGLHALQQMKSVNSLGLHNCPPVDDRLIETLKRMPGLQSVTFSTESISHEGVTRLKAAMPDLTIRFL